ncbi:unnamed protein product [Toxocara canis]|uniref:Uncharacterized protein n=1 Tax=Toxocara canis TaxID=6265 RepID=A0A183UB29_TOXCA|nr:unnamed protein product [Toxocara canis]
MVGNNELQIYPLGGERAQELAYPPITYHYSVGANARHVYVIGSLTENNHSQLYVWDLHRGSARNYTIFYLQPHALIKHLYEIEKTRGMLVCKTDTSFLIYGIRISHEFATISVDQLLLSYPASGNQFWSSARAGNGIIFVAERINNHSLYVAYIHFDQPVRRVLLTSSADTLRFSGQPWVYGHHIYLFETSTNGNDDGKCLTGRLVRTDIKYGRFELIDTKFDKTGHFPEDSYGCMPHRVKHVERDGCLWVISETAKPAVLSIENDFKSVCSVSMLNMNTLKWKKLGWCFEAEFDQLTLDVTPQGTVVLLKKLFSKRYTQAFVDSFYFIKTRLVL